MTDHTDTVRAVKAQLLAQGVNLAGPCGAFQITGRVAWLLRAEGFGLIHSTANGCAQGDGEKYRADTLMLTDGRVWDLLGRAEDNEGDTSDPDAFNIPMWAETGPQPPSNWRAPFQMDDTDVPVPVPPPPPADLAAILHRLEVLGAEANMLAEGLQAARREIEALKVRPIPTDCACSARLFGINIPITCELT